MLEIIVGAFFSLLVAAFIVGIAINERSYQRAYVEQQEWMNRQYEIIAAQRAARQN